MASALATASAAQDAATSVSASASASADEVIVTATRLPQNSLDVAGTVNRIGAEELRRIAPTHAAEALNAVAGVGTHQGSGQEHLTAIRSPVLTGGAGAGSFLFLSDGVPLRAASFGNVNGLFEAPFEFARGIEVVKGPGSVLYGSNAQHGLVNFLSEAPDGSGRARVEASDDGQVYGLLSLSGERTRVSLNLASDNGFRDDSGFDQQKAQLRHDTALGAWDVEALVDYQNLNQETAGFLQEGPDAFRDRDLITVNAFPEAFRDAESARVQARFSREALGGEVALTPYARTSEIAFLRHFVPGQAFERQRHSSVGVLSTLYRGPWIVGLDAEYTNGSLFEFQSNPTQFSFVQGLHYDYEVDAVVLSPYAQREFALGPRTTLTAGARLDYTRYDYTNQADVGVSGRFVRIADRVDDFVTLTPKLDLVHRASESTSLYARLARGARAPQTSDLYSLQTNQVVDGELVDSIDPETLDMVEVGLKHRAGDLAVEVALYAQAKDNFFFRNSNGFNVTDGETEHFGAEVALRWEPRPWLSLDADVALTDQNYTFTDIVGSPSSSIRAGDEVDSAPTTLGRAAVTVWPLEELSLWAEVRHVGSYFTDPGNTRTYPGHEVFNARVDWQAREGLNLFAKLQNVFDARFADRADFAFGNDRFFPGRPRHVRFGVEVNWD